MSYSDYVKLLRRISDNENADDVTVDEFFLVMKYVNDPRDFYEILEAHPEYVDKQDKNGKTALMLAAERGMGDAVRTLIETNDADVFLKDKSGRTAAQYFKQYYEEDPEAMEELGEDGMEFFMDIFQEKARPTAKKTTGLDVVSQQKQMGDLDKLPADAISRVAELSTGLSGTVAQQRQTIRQAVGKGRRRKTQKKRKGKGKRKSLNVKSK